jgi:hypothetical protein
MIKQSRLRKKKGIQNKKITGRPVRVPLGHVPDESIVGLINDFILGKFI